MGGSRARRRVIVATVVVGAVVGTAVVVRQVWLNDSARPVDSDEAVDRFRTATADTSTGTGTGTGTQAPPDRPSATDSTPRPLLSVPEPGVYRYVTDGSEHIDVVGGATHVYPAETTITVTEDGCGVSLRWDLLHERREEWRLCAAIDGVVLQTTGASYHEFFGHGRLEPLICNQSVLLVPLDDAPHPPVTWRCTLDDRPWDPVWEVLERDTRVVEGATIAVTHVRMTVTDDDHYYEHTVVDYWLDAHGLPVEMTAVKESNSPSGVVGDVVYQERFVATLASATPLR